MCREAALHITADPEYIPAWKGNKSCQVHVSRVQSRVADPETKAAANYGPTQNDEEKTVREREGHKQVP